MKADVKSVTSMQSNLALEMITAIKTTEILISVIPPGLHIVYERYVNELDWRSRAFVGIVRTFIYIHSLLEFNALCGMTSVTENHSLSVKMVISHL